MYDANQLVNHLYAEAKRTNPASSIFDRNGDVIITAFVDEYVYVYDPREVYYRSPLTVKTDDKDVNLQLWKDVVNRDNRMLYLCTTGAIYSPDGETSVSDNVFTITQNLFIHSLMRTMMQLPKLGGLNLLTKPGL